MRQVVFDLETTGFRFDEGHRIVEIGGVELVRGALTGKTFHAYVNPQRDVPEAAFRVHGLSAEFLQGFPSFADASIAPAFLEFVGDAELIAHNGISFDIPFINAELEHAGLRAFGNQVVDTLLLARRKFPGSPASLDALCSRFGIDTSRRLREGHGALLDSRLLAEVYIEMTGGLQAGLDFGESAETLEVRIETTRPQGRSRPEPLRSLLTGEEADAHAAFVAAELGPENLWSKAPGRG